MNQHELASACIGMAMDNLSRENEVELIILDNGSDESFGWFQGILNDHVTVKNIRYDESIGVYPTFWEGLRHATGDVLAFFHSDLVVSEKGWDTRVIKEFQNRKKLSLLGFIGSNEIDISGGRGLGTTSNFQGGEVYSQNGENRKVWKGSHASIHGKTNNGFSNAAVIDGCAMIFRRTELEQIQKRNDFPPHHFYDRLLSCEILERGYQVGVLGIECDHISGQTANNEQKYHDMAMNWCITKGIEVNPTTNVNWDEIIYKEAERQWITEYRDVKHIVPIRV